MKTQRRKGTQRVYALALLYIPLCLCVFAAKGETVNYYICIMLKRIGSVFSFLLSLPVLFYRYSISPFLRPACRHVPSCSQYMLDALKLHGPVTGLMMGTARILRCRPGGTHGYDPVPLFRFKRYRPLSELFSRWNSENRLKR